MTRMITKLLILLASVWAVSAFAASTIATVDMQKIFSSAPQVKKINDDLQKKFASRKEKLVKEGEALQADMTKLQKDRSVLKQADLDKLNGKIEKNSTSLREKQVKFQQDLYAAQNEAMKEFMSTLNKAVAGIAKKKGIDAVMPENNLVYANNNLDITKEVLKTLS